MSHFVVRWIFLCGNKISIYLHTINSNFKNYVYTMNYNTQCIVIFKGFVYCEWQLGENFCNFVFEICLYPLYRMYPGKGKFKNEYSQALYDHHKVHEIYIPRKLLCIYYVHLLHCQ